MEEFDTAKGSGDYTNIVRNLVSKISTKDLPQILPISPNDRNKYCELHLAVGAWESGGRKVQDYV